MAGTLAVVDPASSLAYLGWESDRPDIDGTLAVTDAPSVLLLGIQTGSLAVSSPTTVALTGNPGVITSGVGENLSSPTSLQLAGSPGIMGTLAVRDAPSILSLQGEAQLHLVSPTTAAFTGTTGVIGSLRVVDAPSALALQGQVVNVGVEALSSGTTLAYSGTAGIIGSFALRDAPSTFQAVGDVPFLGFMQVASQTSASFTGLTGVIGALAARSQSSIALSGVEGVIGDMALLSPVTRLQLDGHLEIVGTIALVSAGMRLQLTGASGVLGNSQAFALHLESSALSTYNAVGFNSMTRFNNVYLGASDAGIFALTGDDDDGAAVAAVLRSGIDDFGTSHLKRVLNLWVGYEADGDMDLTVITDGGIRTTYRLKATGRNGIYGNRVMVGKGLTSRYWQWEAANVAGSDIKVNCVELEFEKLARRAGGYGA